LLEKFAVCTGSTPFFEQIAVFIYLHKSVLIGDAIFLLEFGRVVVIDLEKG
jgi:hypothetical protein